MQLYAPDNHVLSSRNNKLSESIGLAAYLTDAILSKSRPFILCLATLHASTLLFFLGSDPALVLTARALQGASQAFVWVSGLALLASRVDEAHRLGLFVGYLFMAGTIGELVGPVIGGPLYEAFGHWAVFAFVEALLAVDVALRLAVGNKPDRSRNKTASVRDNCETDSLLHQQPAELIITGNLHWNCLASIMAETVAVTVRCGLEAVRRTPRPSTQRAELTT